MTDRPRFDVDDTTSSYSPPPSSRPRWVDQGWGTGATKAVQAPQGPSNAGPPTGAGGPPPGAGGPPPAGTPHWYDPTWQSTVPAAPKGGSSPTPPRPSAPAPSRGARGSVGMLGLVSVALVAGIAGAMITVGALGAGGYLAQPGTAAGP